MNIDGALEALEEGFQTPETILRRVVVPDGQMSLYGLRRRAKRELHTVWLLSVGERGQQPVAWFLDHKAKGAIRKALSWRANDTGGSH